MPPTPPKYNLKWLVVNRCRFFFGRKTLCGIRLARAACDSSNTLRCFAPGGREPGPANHGVVLSCLEGAVYGGTVERLSSTACTIIRPPVGLKLAFKKSMHTHPPGGMSFVKAFSSHEGSRQQPANSQPQACLLRPSSVPILFDLRWYIYQNMLQVCFRSGIRRDAVCPRVQPHDEVCILGRVQGCRTTGWHDPYVRPSLTGRF